MVTGLKNLAKKTFNFHNTCILDTVLSTLESCFIYFPELQWHVDPSPKPNSPTSHKLSSLRTAYMSNSAGNNALVTSCVGFLLSSAATSQHTSTALQCCESAQVIHTALTHPLLLLWTSGEDKRASTNSQDPASCYSKTQYSWVFCFSSIIFFKDSIKTTTIYLKATMMQLLTASWHIVSLITHPDQSTFCKLCETSVAIL